MFRHSMAEYTLRPLASTQEQIREETRVKGESSFVELMSILQNVEIDTPEAKLNETTMIDNNGGRIKY